MNYQDRIRALREDHDLKQVYIAKLLHVDQKTYSDYELGYVRTPIEILIALAKIYDVNMDYICGLTKEPRPFPKDYF